MPDVKIALLPQGRRSWRSYQASPILRHKPSRGSNRSSRLQRLQRLHDVTRLYYILATSFKHPTSSENLEPVGPWTKKEHLSLRRYRFSPREAKNETIEMPYQGLSQQLVQRQQLLFVTRVGAQGHKRPPGISPQHNAPGHEPFTCHPHSR